MSAISNSQPPVPPDEIPPDLGGTSAGGDSNAPAATVVAPGGPERAISSFPPRLVPYKVEASLGVRRSNRIADRKLPAPSPNLANASAQFIEEKHREFMQMNKEYKDRKRKKGLQVEAQGSPRIPVPRSYNSSRAPSPSPLNSPLNVDQTLFNDERLHTRDIDITDEVPLADRAVSIAPADPATYVLAPPTALPGTDRPTPAPRSPVPVEADDPMLLKKLADSILDVATKDILDRLVTPVALEPPGDEKLALPQILGGPWERIRSAMLRRAACPYARAGDSQLTPVELRLWGGLHEQITGFADEVSRFMESFNERTPRGPEETTADTARPTPQNQFVWSGDDVALAMQAAIFAVSGEVISWDRALQRAQDFDAAHKAHVTPPENNALGLSVEVPAQPRNLQAPTTERTAKPNGAQAEPMPATQPPPKATWASIVAPTNMKPTPAKDVNPPVLNTVAIQRELNQLKAQKAAPTNLAPANSDEDGWNVQSKGRKSKVVPAPPTVPNNSSVPTRKGSFTGGRQGHTGDLEVAFKPKSPTDIDLVKARANPDESRSCLTRLVC